MAGRASVALGLKYGTGDLITQSATKAPDDAFDTRRSGMFLGFGAYCAPLPPCHAMEREALVWRTTWPAGDG